MSRRPWAAFQSFWTMSVSCVWWRRYEDTKSPWRSPAMPHHWPAFLESLDELTQKKGVGGRFQGRFLVIRSQAVDTLGLPVDPPSCSQGPGHMVWPWCHLTWIDTLRPEAFKQILVLMEVGGYALWGSHDCGVSNVFQEGTNIYPIFGGGEGLGRKELNCMMLKNSYIPSKDAIVSN